MIWWACVASFFCGAVVALVIEDLWKRRSDRKEFRGATSMGLGKAFLVETPKVVRVATEPTPKPTPVPSKVTKLKRI